MRVLLFALFVMSGHSALASEVRVAVAANFRAALEDLAPKFQTETGYRIVASAGSTGQLYAQIVRGAPFDVFLAADQQRPRDLFKRGLAESPQTYAIGRLVLLAPDAEASRQPTLSKVRTFSIANPATAPYGRAGEQALTHLSLSPDIRISHAQSVAGVNAAIHAGAAQAGLSAASLDPQGLGWPVPREWYDPIRQDMVILAGSTNAAAAAALFQWLMEPTTKSAIATLGYDVD